MNLQKRIWLSCCVRVFVWLILGMCGCGLDSGGRTLIMGFRAVQSGTHRGEERRGVKEENRVDKNIFKCVAQCLPSLSLHAIPSSSFSPLFKLIHYLHLKQQIQNQRQEGQTGEQPRASSLTTQGWPQTFIIKTHQLPL